MSFRDFRRCRDALTEQWRTLVCALGDDDRRSSADVCNRAQWRRRDITSKSVQRGQVMDNGGPIVNENGSATATGARMFAAIAARTRIPFRVVRASGATFANSDASPAFTITFRTGRAERRLALFGYIGLLESYFAGDVDIDGDLGLAFRAGFESGADRSLNPLVWVRNQWHEVRFSNRSLEQAKANARFHYGLGQAFYRPWLDRVGMMYTCAYWSDGAKTLEDAQRNKMDHVCRKVRLARGETFVDVGSGWGGLLFHAWERYGAIGTGVNTTTEQVAETRAEIERRGLSDKIRVVECDF